MRVMMDRRIVLAAGLAWLVAAPPASSEPASSEPGGDGRDDPFDAGAMDALIVRNGERQVGLDTLLPMGPTLIHLWATWCPPCREELPALAGFAAWLARQGAGGRLVVLSVDGGPYEAVRDFLDRLGLNDLPSWQVAGGNPGSLFRILGYPASLVVETGDRGSRPVTSRVTWRHQGPIDWTGEAVRRDLLSRLAPAPR